MSIGQWVAVVLSVPVALVLGTFALWVVARYRRERRRTGAIRRVAASLGCQFVEQPSGVLGELQRFKLFETGSWLDPRRGLRVRNMLVQRAGELQVTLFDVQWKEDLDGEFPALRERRTVVRIQSQRLDLPCFDIRPNGFYLKLTAGWRCKVPVEHENFARRYDLSCEDTDAARSRFHGGVITAIADQQRSCRFQGHGGDVLLYPVERTILGEGRVAPEHLHELLHFGLTVGQQLLATADTPPAADHDTAALTAAGASR